jgi:hypothetical protein
MSLANFGVSSTLSDGNEIDCGGILVPAIAKVIEICTARNAIAGKIL